MLGSLLYLKTVHYEFTLDDKLYITQNEFVKKGWSGLKEVWSTDLMDGYDKGAYSGLLTGGRYRPLALTFHIIEEEVHGNDPFWGHFLNAILYGALGIVSFLFFSKLSDPFKGKLPWLAIIATTLYVLHPLHVEAIANVRNRDELLSSLLGLLSTLSILSYLKTKHWLSLFTGALLLFMGFLVKESTINFLLVMALTVWLVYPKNKVGRKQILFSGFTIGLSVLCFFMIRHWATETPFQGDLPQELLNNVYMNASYSQRWAGILFMYGFSLKMLVFPSSLTHDYYPYYPFRNFEELQSGLSPYPEITELTVVVSILLLVALLGLMISSFLKRNRSYTYKIITYCIALFFGTTLMYSNVFFEIGSFFNERFLFVASLAMAFIAAYGFSFIISKTKGIGLILVTAFSLMFLGLSWDRISDWENDETLVLNDVLISESSARANLLAAEASLKLYRLKNKPQEVLLNAPFKGYLEQGESYAKRALKIYPEYLAPLDILGNIYFEQGRVEESFKQFKQFYEIKPNQKVRDNLVYLAANQLEKNELSKAVKIYKYNASHFIQAADRAYAYNELGGIYGKQLRQADSSIYFLNESIMLDDTRVESFENLGVAYAISGQVDMARSNFLKAVSLGGESKSLLINIGLTYQQQGKEVEAKKYFDKAKANK